jgi:hypothetical protein
VPLHDEDRHLNPRLKEASMGEETFTEQDVREILEKIKYLTPRQQRLLEALVAVALNAGDDNTGDDSASDDSASDDSASDDSASDDSASDDSASDDSAGTLAGADAAAAGNQARKIIVSWPEGQRRRKFYSYFQRRFAGGKLPQGKGPRADKIGGDIRFDIDSA